jgi:serine phosphatase RsbU (regulator of sigma subunit)
MPQSTLLSAPPAAWLVPIAGPGMEPIELSSKSGGITLGRHDQCDVCLPADAEKVSRMHARFVFDGSRWHVSDLGSRWGTYVNGIKLTPNTDVPLNDGDLIRITPWTFTLAPTAKRHGLRMDDDTGQTIVRSVNPDTVRPLAESMLALLLESAAAIHSAGDEKQLAELVMDAAVRGTGLSNAAMLRPLDAAGHVEIIASKLSSSALAAQGGRVSFSRSLIAAASQGMVAEVGGPGMIGDISQSIVQLKINAAICVPLMLGQTVAAYLYLDSRGSLPQALRPNASAFCVALGRMASLALANLKRIDMEKRSEMIRMELAAAATAQKWIMPKRENHHGRFICIGESRAGQYVGGDFFDVIPLTDTRVAVAVGDVSGKGISASVLMTATQGFLHGALKEHGEPAHAVSDANRFVNPRRPENRFVTMWVGVFDSATGTLSYVDAGHSYAMIKRKDGTFEQLDKGGGPPIGVDPDFQYQAETMKIETGDEVMIVSDGIVEQFGTLHAAEGPRREQFEMSGLQKAMSAPSGADPVADLFNAVVTHAGTTQLSDDATAVLVRW